MTWEAVATFALVMVTFAGINLTALRSMLDRYHRTAITEGSRQTQIERMLFDLRLSLPLEYVRREDWIRFSATLDAKLDALREELREEIGAIKEKLYE
ncbi:MAG TPA: hypothetical protein VN867_00910 [Candidatus Binataceae bacterium]|nr:hypothetical protein [Candidatus Binataceae bacterium]